MSCQTNRTLYNLIAKLRRLNWLRPKSWLESDSNRVLLDFLIQTLGILSNCCDKNWLKVVQIVTKHLILIGKKLKSIAKGQIWLKIIKTNQKVNWFWLFWSFNWYLDQFYWSFNRIYIKNMSKSINFNQKLDKFRHY